MGHPGLVNGPPVLSLFVPTLFGQPGWSAHSSSWLWLRLSLPWAWNVLFLSPSL